jgi:hypothetical protein
VASDCGRQHHPNSRSQYEVLVPAWVRSDAYVGSDFDVRPLIVNVIWRVLKEEFDLLSGCTARQIYDDCL